MLICTLYCLKKTVLITSHMYGKLIYQLINAKTCMHVTLINCTGMHVVQIHALWALCNCSHRRMGDILCTWCKLKSWQLCDFKLYMYLIETDKPPIYLYLIFKICISQNWLSNLIFYLNFLSISNLIFTACVACKNSVKNKQKIKFKIKFVN